MSLARANDQGLDATVLAIAMRQLDRYRKDDIPIGSAVLPELRAYFHGWVQELVSEGADGASGHEKTHNLVVVGSSPTRPTTETR